MSRRALERLQPERAEAGELGQHLFADRFQAETRLQARDLGALRALLPGVEVGTVGRRPRLDLGEAVPTGGRVHVDGPRFGIGRRDRGLQTGPCLGRRGTGSLEGLQAADRLGEPCLGGREPLLVGVHGQLRAAPPVICRSLGLGDGAQLGVEHRPARAQRLEARAPGLRGGSVLGR